MIHLHALDVHKIAATLLVEAVRRERSGQIGSPTLLGLVRDLLNNPEDHAYQTARYATAMEDLNLDGAAADAWRFLHGEALARVMRRAYEVLGVFKALRWVAGNLTAFKGRTPLDYVLLGHEQEVLDEIGRVEHGIY
jgi:hypothetical protein